MDGSHEWMMDDSGRVPVFVFPSEAEFVIGNVTPDDSHPNRKVFTVYNPYLYPIAYKVLCTAPHNYSVTEPDGVLREKCFKDVVIRCKAKLPLGTVDKLRFEIRRLNEQEIHGHKDIQLRTVERPTMVAESSQSSFFKMQTSQHGDKKAQPNVQIDHRKDAQPSSSSAQLLTVIAFVACIAALMTPTIGDPSAASSAVPAWLHLTLPQKLVAAYILGIVTILIVRPTS